MSSQSVTLRNLHASKKDADNLLKLITELLANEDFFELLQPYIDDDFEKLEFDVINGLNADKLKAISHLRRNPHAAFLIAKSELLHRFREGVVHMETAYADLYHLFQRDMDNVLKTGEQKSNGKVAKKKPKLPKKALVAQTNPHSHRERVEMVVRSVNLFAKLYIDDYNKIRKHLFGNV